MLPKSAAVIGAAALVALASGARPPMLSVAYVGARTPHQSPSATPTSTPTSTPSVTSTPTPSPTTTSTFGQNQGQAVGVRPSDGARLPQPIDGEVWVFEWIAPNRGPCLYTGARLTLVPWMGGSIDVDVPDRSYHVLTSDHPLPGGRWRWSVQAHCAHGPSLPSEFRTFDVDPPAPTPTRPATDSPTPTDPATASPTPTDPATTSPTPPVPPPGGAGHVFLPWASAGAP